MSQRVSHSQTPKFDSNKSQTSQVLYREPTAQEQRVSRIKVMLANAKEFALFAVGGTICYAVITFVIYSLFGR
ncbi:hypothetical protein [Acinetobacter sp. MB5]|uniref:hypothetical protein n=1 Tax=Acinetobacter sp. MB5 TaxID=2069438 RepID=UPI000DD09E2E|nr:hypothetical protein [Acinetobacter sp. MB5]